MEQRTFKEVKTLFHHLINSKMEETDFDVMMDVMRDYNKGEHTVLIPESVKQVNPEPMPIPSTIEPRWKCNKCGWDGSELEVVYTDKYSCPKCSNILPFDQKKMHGFSVKENAIFIKNERNNKDVSSDIIGEISNVEINHPNLGKHKIQPENFVNPEEELKNHTEIISKTTPIPSMSGGVDIGTGKTTIPKRKLGITQQQIMDILEKYDHPMKSSDITKNHKAGGGAVSVALSKMAKAGILETHGGKYGTHEMFEIFNSDKVDPELKKKIMVVMKGCIRPITESAIAIRIGQHDQMMFIKALRELKKEGKISEKEHSGSYVSK